MMSVDSLFSNVLFLLQNNSFEKCSLCGDSDIDWKATVVFSGGEVSCHELDSKIFVDAGIDKDSPRCESSQNLFDKTCCIQAPEKPCNLCRSSNGKYFNTKSNERVSYNGEVKTCLEVHHFLNSRREQSSEHCIDAKGELFDQCCKAKGSQTIPEVAEGNQTVPEVAAAEASDPPSMGPTARPLTESLSHWNSYALWSSASMTSFSLWLF